MSEPTEGEWRWYDCGINPDGDRAAGIIASDGNSGRAVARCPRYTTREEWEADARLIVASKRMAKVLNDIVTFHKLLKVNVPTAYEQYDQDQPYLADVIAVLKEAGVYNG